MMPRCAACHLGKPALIGFSCKSGGTVSNPRLKFMSSKKLGSAFQPIYFAICQIYESMMGESLNSQTALSDRKAIHDATSPDREDHISSTALTPHKAVKDEHVGTEPSRSDELVNGDPSLNAGAFKHNQFSNLESDQVNDGAQDKPSFNRLDPNLKDSGTIPSVNWNSGSKAKIRTSFGRNTVGTTPKKPKEARADEKLQDLEPHDGQFYSNITPLTHSSTSESPIRSPLTQARVVDYTSDIKNCTPISTELSVNHHESKSLASRSVSAGSSREGSLKLLVQGDDRSFQTSVSSEEFQEDQETSTNLESDNGLVINIQNRGQESDKELEANIQTSLKVDSSTNTVQVDLTVSDGEIVDSEEGDAMMKNYSRSDQLANQQNNTLSKPYTQKHEPLTLANLSPEELKFQLRYFHLTKSPDTVDRNILVRCLVCAGEGHIAEFCSALTCDICGTQKQHFTKHCPRTKRCAKCRERGHQESTCHYKLPRLAPGEMTCDLCQRDGHNEDNCELLWRTSGRPWESDLAGRNIRLGCYECGRVGHLGNDCDTRRPGKWMGTSTWSLPGEERSSHDLQRGISIKGRAQYKRKAASESSDDDSASFLRPKISETVRKGQIHIVTQSIGRNGPINQSSSKRKLDSWTPNEERYQGDGRKKSRGNWHIQDSKSYPLSRGSDQYNYRPNNRRSISPHYSPRDSYPNGDRYRPSANSSQGGKTGGNEFYRPMPSAAQKAWSRHRL